MEERSIYSRFLEALCFWSLLLALSVTAIKNTWAVVPFAVWFLLKFALEVKSSWQERELK
jgi:hypothetical protein